jgi:hypothetical protein
VVCINHRARPDLGGVAGTDEETMSKSERYLRACKLIFERFRWLREAEWGDVYGLYPHEAKRTIKVLAASCSALLRRAEEAEEEVRKLQVERCKLWEQIWSIKEERTIFTETGTVHMEVKP